MFFNTIQNSICVVDWFGLVFAFLVDITCVCVFTVSFVIICLFVCFFFAYILFVFVIVSSTPPIDQLTILTIADIK